VSDHTVEKFEREHGEQENEYLKLWEESPVYKQTCAGGIVRTSNFDAEEKFYSQYANGLVGGVLRAYNYHHNLILRPDDFWVAILTQLSFYVNARAEQLRDKFVDFQEKKELIVYGGGTLLTADYDSLVDQLTQQIAANLKDDSIRSWVIPQFSTTKPGDQMVCGIVLMSIVQKYFSYKMSLLCGIPNITLLGTVEDYKILSQKVDRLLEFQIAGDDSMKKWHTMLQFVCTNLIASKMDFPDKKFWQCICSYIGNGSGPRFLSGWISTFCVFNETGQWQGSHLVKCKPLSKKFVKLDTNDIPSGIVNVPLSIDDNGTQIETRMLAGSFMCSLPNDSTLQPRLDFCIAKIDSTKQQTGKFW